MIQAYVNRRMINEIFVFQLFILLVLISSPWFIMQKQWTEMFPWNIGSASILDVISPGTGGSRNGALHLV